MKSIVAETTHYPEEVRDIQDVSNISEGVKIIANSYKQITSYFR